MQRDAIARAREMQKRASNYVPPNSNTPKSPPTPNQQATNNNNNNMPRNNNNSTQNSQSNNKNADNFHKDNHFTNQGAKHFDIPPPEKKPNENSSVLGFDISKTLNGLLGGMKIDEEKVLIGLLIYVLAKNGSDIKLLLALGYLLL